jgi:carboxyl-terminal processing protease
MNLSAKPPSLRRRLLSGGAIATLATGSLITPAFIPSVWASALEICPKATVDQVWQIVNNEFVAPDFNHVDWQHKRQELLDRDYVNDKQAYKAIREALKELGDPYTRFLDPKEFDVLTSQTSGELSGVGLRLAMDRRTSDLFVVDAIRSSPAMQAGIQRGDRILRIDGKPTALMTLEQATDAIQGEIGTEVSLQILRQDKKTRNIFEVSLKRSQIEIPSVSYNLNQEGQIRVGYIKLDEFSSHAAEQMQQAIAELQKQQVSGFVLDLRGNPGGLLFSSVDIARLWMEQGAIVKTVDRKGGNRSFSANGKALTNLPLVVLVDRGSASASEILAGALKENGRATLIGTTTYGKGTVQSVHTLADGSGLAVTIAHYYPPSGTDINHKGINPDVYLDLSGEQLLRLRQDPSLMGTKDDPQYWQAVSVLQSRRSTFPPSLPKPVGIRLQELP